MRVEGIQGVRGVGHGEELGGWDDALTVPVARPVDS
jgi:hypothetical protein